MKEKNISKKKVVKPPDKKHVNPNEIRLVRGKGSKQRGGGAGGFYWHIYVGETRAGYVYINIIDEPPFGEHPSIQIFINKNKQGQHIGRHAYRMACEQSDHEFVIAHMRKSNIASRRAAEIAGFTIVEDMNIPQLAMIWRCHDQNSSG